MSRVDIVYVSHEFPSISQTFVWNEFVQIRARFPSARLYAVHRRGACQEPVFGLRTFLRSRAAWRRVVSCLTRVLLARGWWTYLLAARSPRDVARSVFVLINAVALAAQCELGRTHLHAHFLGITLEVAYVASLCLGSGRATFSGTGHAGDVIGKRFTDAARQAISSAEFLVSASEAVRLAARQTFPDVPNVVVHCGVARAPLARTAVAPSTTFTVLTVARLVEKKGYDVALDVAAELARRGSRFKWLSIGSGPERVRLARRSEPLERLGVWSWLGSKAHDEVLRHMEAEADVFVLPSTVSLDGDVDGIPVALMEAMARGIPVITTDVGGIGELVKDGRTGRLLNPGDRDALLSTLETLSHDHMARRRLGLAGRRYVQDHFSQEAEASKLAELFLRAGVTQSEYSPT